MTRAQVISAILLALLCVGAASAAGNLIAYYSFDGNSQDASGYGYNFSNNGFGYTSNSSCIIAPCAAFGANATNTSVNITALNGLTNYTISFWSEQANSLTGGHVIAKLNSSSAIGMRGQYGTYGGVAYVMNYELGASVYSNAAATNFQKTMWTFVSNTTGRFIYKNGAAGVNSTSAAQNIGMGNVTFGWNGVSTSDRLYGIVDEVSIYNRSLTPTEVSCLYNSGSGRDYAGSSTCTGETLAVSYPYNYTITAVTSEYNGTALSSYNATVNGTLYVGTGASITTNITVWNGSEYKVSNVTIPILINATNHIAYYNFTNITWNITTTLHPFTGLNISDTINRTNITAYTIGWYDTLNNSDAGYRSISGTNELYPFLPTGTYNISVNSTNYFNNQTIKSTNSSVNITLTPYAAIRVFYGTLMLNNFTANYTTGTTTETIATTNRVAYLPLYNNTYNVTIYNINTNGTNYAMSSANLTANPYNQTYNFSVYMSNTVNVYIWNENTQSCLSSVPVNAYFVGTIISYNYTTNNCTINASLLYPQNYQIIFSSSNYSTRNYYMNLVNQSVNTINAYMLPVSYNVLQMTLVDQSYNVLIGYYIGENRKNLTGTNYFEVERCLTDINGQCLEATYLCLTNDTTCPFYNYYIYNSSGIMVGTTGDTRITTSTQTIQLSNTENNMIDVINQFGMAAGVTIDNNTGDVTYTLSNFNSITTTASIKIDRRLGNTWSTIYSASQPTSSSAVLTTNVNLSLGDEFRACGYYTNNGQVITAECTNYIGTLGGAPASSQAQVSGWLLLVIVILPLFFMAYNPVIPPVVSIVFMYLFNILGLLRLEQTVIGGIAVIVFIVLWVVFQ